MKKKILVTLGMCICILVTGCSSGSGENKGRIETEQTDVTDTTKAEVENESQAETEKTIQNQKPDYVFVDVSAGGKDYVVPDTVKSPEKYTYANEELRITQEQKNAFIETYGNAAYESAVSSLSIILHLQKNNSVAGSYITELKENYTVEELVLTSELDGHHITADYIMQPDTKDNDTVIMVHGIGGSRRTMKEYVLLFLEKGYNVLTYDQRSSGENDGFLYTLGVWEQYDLMECINYIDGQISADKKIIVLGQSSGGTSTGLILGNKEAQEKVDYTIFDFPVTSVYELIKSQIIGFVSIDSIDFVLQSCEDFMKFMYGFGFEDGEVANFVADTTIPVLIFTSKADGVVSMSQSQLLYDTMKGNNKKIVISEVSQHCEMKDKERELYEKEIEEFLK